MKQILLPLFASLALAATAPFAAAEERPASPVAQALDGALVNSGTNQSTVPFEDYAALNDADFFVFYYSAGWCGPCRRFTPGLIEKYNELKEQHDNFELVFYSRDRSEEEMAGYMNGYPMPWPAVAYDRIDDVAPAAGNRTRAIPGMVILDRDGEVVASSHPSDGDRVGARGVIEELEKLLGGS